MIQSRLIMAPPGGAGICWYCAENASLPICSFNASSTSTGSRSGDNASPNLRRYVCPAQVGIASSESAIAGRLRTSHSSDCSNQKARQVIDVNALHHNDNGAGAFVIQ